MCIYYRIFAHLYDHLFRALSTGPAGRAVAREGCWEGVEWVKKRIRYTTVRAHVCVRAAFRCRPYWNAVD